MSSYVTCACSNVRSVRNKITEIAHLIEILQIDIFAIVESWLSELDSDNILATTNCNLIRRDRGTRGGGLLLLLNKNILFKNIYKHPTLEIMATEIIIHKKSIRLIVVYIQYT